MTAAPRPSVSVVIPAYNQSHFLAEAIQTALDQTEAPLQVIVVDDGSTDDTPGVVEHFGDRIVALRQANAGVAAARNAGAARAEGDLLAFLDSDDRWHPTKLERQVDRFVADPELGLVHCGVRHIDADGNPLDERLDGQEGWVRDEYLLLDRAVVLAGSSTIMLPTALFAELGGFDVRLAVSADWDLGFRVACGHRIGFVAEPLLDYRLHGSNMTGRVDVFERDMFLAFDKAFADPALAGLRRRSVGRLHRILAGVALGAGDRRAAVSHLARALVADPTTVPHLLALPVRRLRRRASRAEP